MLCRLKVHKALRIIKLKKHEMLKKIKMIFAVSLSYKWQNLVIFFS